MDCRDDSIGCALLSQEQIATATDKTIEEIDAIIDGAKMKKDGEGQ